MKFNTLSHKIGLGYLLMGVVLIVVVMFTIAQMWKVQAITEEMSLVSEPSASASLRLESGRNKAAAALRGWVITGDEIFKEQRSRVWSDEITPSLSSLEKLSANWNSASIERLDTIKLLFDELKIYQEDVEALTLTDPEAANNLLLTKEADLTFRINDLLKEMTKEHESIFSSDFDRVLAGIEFLNILEWMLLAVGLVVGGLLAVIVTRSVTRPVADAVLVAENIGAGNLETDVNVGGSYELDVLGGALVNMRDSLREKTRQTQRFNWQSTGQNRLNDAMRGDKTVERLADSITSFMAAYAGASIGTLYLVNEGSKKLIMSGGYAFSRGQVKDSFTIGEGLIGQVAEELKPMLITDIDEKYIRIRSSLLDAPPRNIYICPFAIEGRVFGVLELGKFETFNDMELEFIQASMESVGIALNSAVAREKIQQLLEETQQQGEELQQQQEELEQSNEELEEQAQRLREQQEELQASNEEMEEQTQIILQKNRDLENARESIELKAKQLEVSSKYKSEFLANMSHELRTPLNSLLILANDLARNGPGNLDAEQVESAEVISKSGHDLLNLINDILDLAKVEAGKLDLNITDIPITGLADNLSRNFRRTAQEKNLTLSVSVDPDLPDDVRTDRNRLEQILRNLISNAIKFTDKGEVKVDFRMKPGGSLAISVTDSGIGIPSDKHNAIFEAFVQLEGGISRKYGGTGLGLSICRELASLLKGSLSVKSEVGKGSTFTLLLPLEIYVSKPDTEETRRKQTTSTKQAVNQDRFLDYPTIGDNRSEIIEDDHTVLIIEDDDNFARILGAQAVERGLKHINAATGEDGLSLARKYKPNAIILDIDLPGVDGHYVLRELKNDTELRHIPVHIMSVSEKTLDPIRSGAVDYLTKPVTKDQLDGAFFRIEDFINRKMKNLLIVEDDEVMRKAIRKLIGNSDVRCIEAGTAKDALEVIRQQPVDCMVLDVGLPDMSGFELIRLLESEKGGSMPPIIVYTGRELSKRETDELQQYAETIIVKGVKSEERLLDETALFLHRTVSNLPKAKQDMITRMYDKDELLRGCKVLLVDDDMRNVFALSKVLKDRGMSVVKAENGSRALALLESEVAMDFVLMDIMMPEMDGYECMRRIRAKKEFRDLPIVCLTAKAMKDDRQKCIDAGANDYISKPVDVERLISLMRIWIKK